MYNPLHNFFNKISLAFAGLYRYNHPDINMVYNEVFDDGKIPKSDKQNLKDDLKRVCSPVKTKGK